MNQLSDHQMVFTNIENIANIDKVSKYIEVEKSDEISKILSMNYNYSTYMINWKLPYIQTQKQIMKSLPCY